MFPSRFASPVGNSTMRGAAQTNAGMASRVWAATAGAAAGEKRGAVMPDAKTKTPASAARSPDFAELLARAEALVPVLRERAGRAEELRRLPDEAIDELHQSGLFRLLQPKRVGGSELPFRSIVELVSVIGRGDGSTAWVLANLAAHHWLLGMWPEQAQDEIWGESPDNLIGSALIFPRGRARKVPGGYRLSGRWPFSSGVDPAAWNLIGAILQDEETGTTEPRIFLLPARDYTIIDTWQVIGLAGTGSKDVAVEDVFVPDYRSVAVAHIPAGANPGTSVNPSWPYPLPPLSRFAVHQSGRCAVAVDRRRRDLCTQPIATRFSRRPCGKRALRPQLGHQRRDVRPRPARPVAGRDAVNAKSGKEGVAGYSWQPPGGGAQHLGRGVQHPRVAQRAGRLRHRRHHRHDAQPGRQIARHDRQFLHLGVAQPAAGVVEQLALRAEPAGLSGRHAFRRQHPAL